MVVKNIDDEFDPNYYMNKYPDVKNAYGTNSCDLYTHFKTYGVIEGRFPSYNMEKQAELDNPTFSQNYIKFNDFRINDGTKIETKKFTDSADCRQYCNDLDNCAGYNRNTNNKKCYFYSGDVFPNGKLEERSKRNTFIREKVNNTYCDPECKRDKKLKTLEEKYQKSLYNYESAPERLRKAKKKFVIFKNGEPYYQELYKKELDKIIDGTIRKIFQQYKEKNESIKFSINDFKQKYNLYNNHLNKYLTDINETNVVFNDQLYETIKDKQLDARKSYYETQETDNIRWYSRLFTFIYYIIVIIYLVLFILNGSFKSIPNIILLLVLIFLPLIWFYVIVKYISILVAAIYSRLPKNVYYDI